MDDAFVVVQLTQRRFVTAFTNAVTTHWQRWLNMRVTAWAPQRQSVKQQQPAEFIIESG